MDKKIPLIIYNLCLLYFSDKLDLSTFKLCTSSITIKFKYISVYCKVKKEELMIIYEDKDGSNNISFHIDSYCVYSNIDKIYESISECININI